MKNTKANFNALRQENEDLKKEVEYYKNNFTKAIEEIHEIDKLLEELREVNENNYRTIFDIKIMSQSLEYELSKKLFTSKKAKELNKKIQALTLGFIDVNI